MIKEIKLVEEFHKKFKAPVWKKLQNISKDRYDLRYFLMNEEVQEYLSWAKSGDLENITKELCDILYTVYGTIIEHWLQDKIEDCFREVHRSQMTKDYSPWKMIKWKNYSPENLKDILEK